MTDIYILDDHPIVRQGLGRILECEPRLNLAGEASSYRDLKGLLANGVPDVLILDISMPDCDGLDVLKDLSAAYPEMKILVLTVHPEDQLAVRCIKSGAFGYLNKGRVTEELVAAIQKVVGGGHYVTEAVAEKLASGLNYQAGTTTPHEKLSDREFQVLRLIAGGMKPEEIARRLSLSPSTVRTYRERVLEKMNMGSDSELTYYAVKNKIIE